MAKGDSIQKKLSRVRPPRVQITYDVEIGGAIEKKELPFVLGVMGDFSGMPEESLPRMRDRKFVAIDRDNFNEVMRGCAPRLVFRVDNKLAGDDSQLPVELKFKSLADFEPENVAKQVEPLRKLLEARGKLSDLRNKLYGNDKLNDLLQDILQNTDSTSRLGKETKAHSGTDGTEKKDGPEKKKEAK